MGKADRRPAPPDWGLALVEALEGLGPARQERVVRLLGAVEQLGDDARQEELAMLADALGIEPPPDGWKAAA